LRCVSPKVDLHYKSFAQEIIAAGLPFICQAASVFDLAVWPVDIISFNFGTETTSYHIHLLHQHLFLLLFCAQQRCYHQISEPPSAFLLPLIALFPCRR
jgi:hypothetical protein